MRTPIVSLAVLTVIAIPAGADRPVADAERTKLVAAVAAAGCSGGKMDWDAGDREFEVDDAQCEGRRYDLKFSADYTLKSRKPEN
jgi:hypothetical protein